MSIDLLNSLLDSTVDDLADLPVFKARPAGTYKAQFEYEINSEGELPYFVYTFKLMEIMELVNPDEAETLDFTKEIKVNIYAFPFYKDKDTKEIKKSDRGEGLTKIVVLGLKDEFGGSSNRETLEAGNGAMVGVTIGVERRKDKDVPGKINENNVLVAVQAIS